MPFCDNEDELSDIVGPQGLFSLGQCIKDNPLDMYRKR